MMEPAVPVADWGVATSRRDVEPVGVLVLQEKSLDIDAPELEENLAQEGHFFRELRAQEVGCE